MITYIISDIHGNYEALKVCLDDIDQSPDGRIICLGDIVGYGAQPNECVDTIRERAELTVMGNHDASAIDDKSLEYFNQYAKEAMLWTRKTLRPENLDYLRSLPMTRTLDNMYLVHATPHNPEEWNYIFYLSDAELNFKAFEQQVCFVGHSHQPVILEQDAHSKIYINREGSTVIQDDGKYIINAGSVGQPRDLDPKLCYCIYNHETGEITLKRLDYPVEKAQGHMREAGLHPFLIERLSLGR